MIALLLFAALAAGSSPSNQAMMSARSAALSSR
jgi:hypothetical protein